MSYFYEPLMSHDFYKFPVLLIPALSLLSLNKRVLFMRTKSQGLEQGKETIVGLITKFCPLLV